MGAADAAAGHGAALQDQLALFRPLLALSMVMTSSRDETGILRIATTAVPSLGGCRPKPSTLMAAGGSSGWLAAR